MTSRWIGIGTLALAALGAGGGVASAGSSVPRDVARQVINLDNSTVVIYEDGRVYRRVEMGDWGRPSAMRATPKMAPAPPPGGFEWAMLSDDALDELVERIEELGLLDDELDFGDPAITDSPTSGVDFAIDDERVNHSVYAPGYDGGLTAEQQENRAAYDEFRGVMFDLDGEFGGELSEFAPYVPAEWVLSTPGYVGGGDIEREWPLSSAPASGDCVELPLEGDGAEDTATGGYLFDGDVIVVADATLPNDPRCA